MDDNKTLDKNSQLFLSLVTSMHVGAMYQLGKTASPISGKVERDLRQAQYTVDLLSMLEEKTSGNLDKAESDFLSRVLSELRMNYLDESQKPDPVAEGAEEGEREGEEAEDVSTDSTGSTGSSETESAEGDR